MQGMWTAPVHDLHGWYHLSRVFQNVLLSGVDLQWMWARMWCNFKCCHHSHGFQCVIIIIIIYCAPGVRDLLFIIIILVTVGPSLYIGVGTGGGQGGRSPPHFPGRGGGRRFPPPHFWARTLSQDPAKIPLLSPKQFHSILTPDQSVRCFEKFIGVGTRGGGLGPLPPRVSPVCVCRGGGPSCWKPLRASFSVSSDIIFCIISVYQSKNKP